MSPDRRAKGAREGIGRTVSPKVNVITTLPPGVGCAHEEARQ
jgi:hypothetical protein